MSDANHPLGYVLGEEHVVGRVSLDWIGVVYETREAAEEAQSEAWVLGESEINVYEIRKLSPREFGKSSS
ncbi:hypothetical protein CH273_13075 [Rhodococcus sp. 05-339-2]|uniref:hypothetical protein n=1 Tax=Rhodococcoides fascians TaxID=1828 RepID=UPI00050C19D5|nr:MULTISPECIES: hypothetical protein [Rhodococcus]OZD81603.1 hypothetical protein CH273_13075 [Rhodococcus sp. 05-339-2]